MVIDTHCHLMSPNVIADAYWDKWVWLFSELSGRSAETVRGKLGTFWDDTGDKLIEDMNAAGISQSWVSPLDLGLARWVGEAPQTIVQINKGIADVVHASNGRLVGLAGIDPRRPDAAALLEEAVTEWGLSGLKLLPPAGFYPNSDACYRLYEVADRLRIPVCIHTGPEMTPLYSKYGQPIFVDDVATDFPNLTIIMAHAGFCWWREALDIMANKPNVHVDLAGWQSRAYRDPVEELYRPLRTMIDSVGAKRILFGSDWPALRLFKGGQKTWVDMFVVAEQGTTTGIQFSREEIAAIMVDNARRVMGDVDQATAAG